MGEHRRGTGEVPWERLASEAWRSARRGRHAQGLRMARAAASALERRGLAAGAARARLVLARLLLERGDTAAACEVCGDVEPVAARAGDLRAAAAATLWRGWALADRGAYAEARQAVDRLTGGEWAVPAWGVAAAVARRSGTVAPVPPDATAWRLPACEVTRPLLLAAWAVRVEHLIAAGDLFKAGCLVSALRESVTVDDPAEEAEAVLAHLRLAAATGDGGQLPLIAAQALRRADAAHLPWARLRALAVWRDAAAALARPDAGVLRTRVRRLAARAPAGWRDAATEPDTGVTVAARSGPERPRPQEAGGRLVAGLIGESDVMRQLRQDIVRAARTAFPVLIEGESGTGKELVARGLHALSARAGGPFRDLNCAALTEDLVDAELFGHVRGAFTGAVAGRPGLIEDASGGTLFLDEVADLSPRAQAKLLRVFQEREVRRVGEVQARPVDVRLVAACNRPLDREAEAGRFRADLLYRIAVIRIRVPPLRHRPGDVQLIVQACWPSLAAQAGTVAVPGPDVLEAFARYAWPGNVRELLHVLAALAVRAPSEGVAGRALLPETFRGEEPGMLLPFAEARDRFEGAYVREALARHGASPTRAARAIGLSRQGLRKVLARTADEVREGRKEPIE